MKRHVLGIAFALLLIGTLAITPTRVKAFDGQIKIGIIGPVGLPHYSPGMKEAAEMARDEINGAGGVNIGGLLYEIVLAFGNDHTLPPPGGNPALAASEMERLCDPLQEGCDFVIGGFRTETTAAMIEVAADYGVPYFINGASTSELLGDTICVDYARYKYLFRVNPVNSTMLFYTIALSLAYYLIPVKLLPLYGQDLDSNPLTPPQVRVAVIAEDLTWTLEMYTALTHPAIYPSVLGPYANVTYAGRIPDGTTDCSSWLNDVKASGARLLIHIFSGATGVPFIMQWKALNVSALPVGINVMGQLQSHWATTGGTCEYESILAFSGTRTPIIPGLTEVFWDNFVALTGTWPLYTAWGAYDGIYGLKEAIEDIDTTDKDALVAYYENPAYMRQGLNGIFKYTNSSTSRHDVVVYDLGPTWDYGFVRAFVAQWTAERMEVVIPLDQVYSKKWAIPPNMYPLIEDINYDGKVDIKDVALAAKAFGTVPGDPRWEKEADINFDDKVDIKDIATIAKQFGTVISLPLP